MKLSEIAALVGGVVYGDPDVEITGVNGIREAQAGDLTFIRDGRYAMYLHQTQASAVLMDHDPGGDHTSLVVVAKPDLAFAQVLQVVQQHKVQHPRGISEHAFIGRNVRIGKNVAIDAFVRVSDDAVIEDEVVLYSGVYLGRGSHVGEGTVLYPNVTVREECRIGQRCVIHANTAIGSDGFGFAWLNETWVKIPQVGRVEIEDDVEIGSNTAIDRATFGVTRIRRGTKIDNLVQVGHNVEIGEHCAIAGKTGIAGSARIGNRVKVGAQSGINGHIEIGDGATVAARAGVTKSLEPGALVSGFPAIDHQQERRIMVAQLRLPELLRRVKQLERRLDGLNGHTNEH